MDREISMDFANMPSEEELILNFSEKYLANAVRIHATQTITSYDVDLVLQAIAIVLTLYYNKESEGKLKDLRTIH